MTQYLVGTGGWGYFKIPYKPSLRTYSKIFNFVEVNSTFYKIPKARMAEKWRRAVPNDFTFTVRCHQDLTHRIRLRPIDEAFALFSQMIGICRILKAPFLHLLTPPPYVFDDIKIREAEDFLSSVDLKGIHLAWEVRSPLNSKLVNFFQEQGIVHSVDLSREEPAFKSETIYTRVFGKGKHNIYQFTDDELKKIDRKVIDAAVRIAIITWHGVRMNSDASRFKVYKESGRFLPVTAYTGVDSARSVLQEDAKFPSTKIELIADQGWKVIDLTDDKRIHLSELLSKIPDKTYNNVFEVTKEFEGLL